MKVYAVLRHVLNETEVASIKTDMSHSQELVESLNILEKKRAAPNPPSVIWECEEHDLDETVS
jgi:hypothetical protein